MDDFASDLTIKFINQKALSLIKFIKYKDVIGKAINDINELEVLRNKILYSKKKRFPNQPRLHYFGGNPFL